jgi:hypothetical protein
VTKVWPQARDEAGTLNQNSCSKTQLCTVIRKPFILLASRRGLTSGGRS